MVVMLVVMVTAGAAFLMVVMVVMMFHLLQILLHGGIAVHGVQQLRTGQFMPGGRHQGGMGIVFPQQRNGSIQLGLRNGIRAGQNDSFGSFHLIVVEFTEILHVDLHLAGIHNRHRVAQLNILSRHLFNGSHHIGQLSHAGGLDHDPVGMILLDHLGQSLAEIANQAAANAAGIHFCDVDARILQKAAVNADLAEFVLDQHQLLAAICFLDHFLDQSGLAGTKEAGINIDFCHSNTF